MKWYKELLTISKKCLVEIPRIIKTKVAEPSLCCVHRFLTSLYTVIFSLQLQLRVRVCCVRDRAKDKKRKVVGSWKERNSLSCYTYVMCIYACSYFHRFHNLVFMNLVLFLEQDLPKNTSTDYDPKFIYRRI